MVEGKFDRDVIGESDGSDRLCEAFGGGMTITASACSNVDGTSLMRTLGDEGGLVGAEDTEEHVVKLEGLGDGVRDEDEVVEDDPEN